MLIAYWHTGGIEIYHVKGSETRMVASGSIDSLQPFKELGTKILIVARSLLLHTRKRYPPTTSENITKAVRMDIEDIFPLEKPNFFFRTFEKTSTYCLVDIWAWESSQYEKIKKVFDCTHVLPEDMAFISEETEVSIFQQNGLQNLIAHNKNGFLEVFSTRTLTENTLEMFLHRLGRDADRVKRIVIYNTEKVLDKDSLGTIPLVYEQRRDYPLCLRDITRINLKEFKVRGENPFAFDIRFIQRVIIYILVIYSLSLYIKKGYFEQAIDEVSKKLDGLKIEQSSLEKEKQGNGYSEVITEFREKRKLRSDPLFVMDSLAKFIPDGSYITRMSFGEGHLELSCSSKDPLVVIEKLSHIKCFKSVKLKGAPLKNAEGIYNFALLMELMPCQ